MRRVASLPVTFGLLACLAVADIPHTLYNAVSIFLARISLADVYKRQGPSGAGRAGDRLFRAAAEDRRAGTYTVHAGRFSL